MCVTTKAVETPEFITQASKRYGAQCIVAGIDYKKNADGKLSVFSNCGKKSSRWNPRDWALHLQDAMAGEIMLCSIDRDGTMSGYDLDIIANLSDELEIPLIASSGAGSLDDCYRALNAGASAITISSMFLFSDHSPIKVRSYLSSNGVSVRSQKGSHS